MSHENLFLVNAKNGKRIANIFFYSYFTEINMNLFYEDMVIKLIKSLKIKCKYCTVGFIHALLMSESA